RGAATSAVRDVDAHALAIRERGHDRAQRLRGPATAPDHASPVLRRDVHLEHVAPRRRGRDDAHVVRAIHDPLDDVLERGGQHGDYSAVSSAGASAASAGASAGSSAFFSAFGFTTDFLLESSSNGAFSSATLTVL